MTQIINGYAPQLQSLANFIESPFFNQVNVLLRTSTVSSNLRSRTSYPGRASCVGDGKAQGNLNLLPGPVVG